MIFQITVTDNLLILLDHITIVQQLGETRKISRSTQNALRHVTVYSLGSICLPHHILTTLQWLLYAAFSFFFFFFCDLIVMRCTVQLILTINFWNTITNYVTILQARRKRCDMAAVAAPKICREREKKEEKGGKKEKRGERKERGEKGKERERRARGKDVLGLYTLQLSRDYKIHK